MVHICTKVHEHILDGIEVIEDTRFSKQKFQWGIIPSKNSSGVAVLVLCTWPDGGLYLYKL